MAAYVIGRVELRWSRAETLSWLTNCNAPEAAFTPRDLVPQELEQRLEDERHIE